MVRDQVILFVAMLKLCRERYGYSVLTTLGQGYGRPEQRPGYFGSN